MTAAYILVAEDSPTQALQIRARLESAGYRVELASDGKQALDSIRNSRPDLVLTDLQMPVMTGLELVEATYQEFPGLPIVLTTSEGSEEIAAEALRKGATSYVPKRFLADLVPTIDRILSVLNFDLTIQSIFPSMESTEATFAFGNDTRFVLPLVSYLQDSLKRIELVDEHGANRIATALTEALQNAVIHGNLEVSSSLREIDGGRPYIEQIEARRNQAPYSDRRVFVHFRATRDEAQFVIRDQGPGFNPAEIADPLDEENITKISGRGLLLINAFLDDVKHNERGNEITMIKRRVSDESDE